MSLDLIHSKVKLSHPHDRTTDCSPMPGSRNYFHAVPVTMKLSAIG